jgi:2-methylcitrate dehydratase PrpD
MEGLRVDWEAGKVGFKMYPNVTSIHAALDALRSILLEEYVTAAQVKEIQVGCGHMTFVHTAWDYRPIGVTAAQMNMYYGLSVMALKGNVSPCDYSGDSIADPEIVAFVLTTDGRILRREVLHRRGSPENPVTRQDVEAKFDANVSRLLGPGAADRLKSLAAKLDVLTDAKEIIDIIAAPFDTQRDES